MAPISRKRHILDSILGDSISQNDHQAHSRSASFSSDASSNSSSSDNSTSFPRPPTCLSPNDSMSSSFSDYSGPSKLPPQFARVNRVILDKNSDEYRKRRERNNIAVKKSRTKSKLKTMETMHKVNILKAENDYLVRKVDILSRELTLLKDIFVAHASSVHGTKITEHDLRLLTGSSDVAMETSTSLVPPGMIPISFRDRTMSETSSMSEYSSASPQPLTILDQPSATYFDSRRYSLSVSSRSDIHSDDDE